MGGRTRPPRLPPRLRRLLDECPLPVEFVAGRRHWRVLIGGEQVLVLSYGSSTSTHRDSDRNDAAHVRRYLQRRFA